MALHILGNTRVSRVGDGVPLSLTLLLISFPMARLNAGKVRFGGTPKPTRETRVLPKTLTAAGSPLHHGAGVAVRRQNIFCPTGNVGSEIVRFAHGNVSVVFATGDQFTRLVERCST